MTSSKIISSATVIDISRIDHLIQGQLTKRFNAALGMSVTDDSTVDTLKSMESTSLSIIYWAESSLESLDVIVPDASDFANLYKSLENLMKLQQEQERSLSVPLRLLQYHMISMGKKDPFQDHVTLQEFYTLCERLNAPIRTSLKKEQIAALYKDMLKDLKRTHPSMSDLPFWAVAELLKDVQFLCKKAAGMKAANEDPLSKLWNAVMGTDPVTKIGNPEKTNLESISLEQDHKFSETSSISSVAFLSYVRSEQKEFNKTLDDCNKIIHTLDQQIATSEDFLHQNLYSTSEEDYRLSKQKFINYLMGDDNDLMDPVKGMQNQDMTYPLSNYFISASHDTYLNCWESIGKDNKPKVDGQMFSSALARGARCLELDVWDSPSPSVTRKQRQESPLKHDPVPLICRKKPKTLENTIDFPVVLKIIRQFALANPEGFPIILKIENHCSYAAQEKMAQHLSDILGSSDLLVIPDQEQVTSKRVSLPSPESMKGKVVIMGKRPKDIRDGAKIVNDDYDAENDQFVDNTNEALPQVKSREEGEDTELEESKTGIVIGFDAAGPVRSKDPEVMLTRHTPGELLWMAQSQLDKVKVEAAEAETKASEKFAEAEKAERELEKLIAKAGLTKPQVEELSKKINNVEDSFDPDDHVHLLDRQEDQGIEVQDFFGDAVEGAKLRFTKADSLAIEAAESATASLQILNEATAELREAEMNLESAQRDQQKTVNQYQKAAANARATREDFEQMQERVEKLRDMLEQLNKSSISNENAVATAMTEAKISEKRASETEARAARAASAASKDRKWAEEETHKEEILEKDASRLHEKMRKADDAAKSSREKRDKAAQALDRLNEQIKLIEQSSQYTREKDEYDGEEKKVGSPTKIVSKHASKLEERRMLSSQIKSYSIELARAEEYRIEVAADFEQKAVLWKEQTAVASKARRQADKSSHLAEELAEHAEEEREAANLRHVARKKAQSNVSAKEDYQGSLRTQLEEAQKQAKEAKVTADQARIDASRLTHLNDNINGHEVLLKKLKMKQGLREMALRDYQSKESHRKETEVEASSARRLYQTSESVYKDAIRDASKQEKAKILQRHSDRNVIVMFNEATLAKKQAELYLEEAKYAQFMVTEKEVEVRRAKEYFDKTERISEIPASLAKITFLHTTKYRYWEKSETLPNSNVHSFASSVLHEMTEKTQKTQKKMREFTTDHICRAFPSRKAGKFNTDPLRLWGMGCQVVSMNMTTFDEHILKADGWFRTNGSCGYVLKPSRQIDSLSEHAEQWTINVLCGAYLPSPPWKKSGVNINPYVKISVYDYGRNSIHHRTEVAKSNGLNPVWDDKDFEFICYTPSMSMLLFSVWDKGETNNGGFIGASAMPISCIREGYRSVPLFDRNNTRSGPHAFSSLLVLAQKSTG